MSKIKHIFAFLVLVVAIISGVVGFIADISQIKDQALKFLISGGYHHLIFYVIFVFLIITLSCIIFLMKRSKTTQFDIEEMENNQKNFLSVLKLTNNFHGSLSGSKTEQPFDYKKISLEYFIKSNGDAKITYRYTLKTYSESLLVWKSFTEGDDIKTKIRNLDVLNFKAVAVKGTKHINWLPTNLSGVSFEACLFFMPAVKPNSTVEFTIEMDWPNYYTRLLNGHPDDFWIVYLNRLPQNTINYSARFIFDQLIPDISYEVSGFKDDGHKIDSFKQADGKQVIEFKNKKYSPELYGVTKPKLILQKS